MDLAGKTILIVDLEANGLLPDVSKVWQLSMKVLGAPTVDSYNHTTGFREATRRMLEADHVVMHNGLQYDLPVIEQVLGVTLDWHKVIDTMVLSRLGKPEKPSHALATYGERFGIPKPIHEDWTKWSPAMEYRCEQDVIITEKTFELFKPMLALMPRAVEIEHACHWECGKIMRRGFRLDEPYVYEQVSRLLAEQEEILNELHEVYTPVLVPVEASPAKRVRSLKMVNKRHPLHGQLDAGVEYCPVQVQEFNPASTQQVADRLIRRYGWKPSAFTPTGLPEVSEKTLSGLPYPEARVFLKYLDNQKNLGFMHGEPKAGKGGGWLHHTRDGRVYAYLNACKAVTGRPSCSAPNLQQVPKVAWLRRAFLPTEGRRLVGVDASGIELRILGHYLAPLDGGAYAREVAEGDVHARMRDALGFDFGNPKIGRDQVKRAEYGEIYGAGNWKLGLIKQEAAWAQGHGSIGDLTKAGRAIKKAIRDAIPGYRELDKSVKDRAKLYGKLKGLDGRTLWVRQVYSSLNLLIQSGAIIVIKEAMRLAPEMLAEAGLVEDVDYFPVMWVHDEYQIEATPEAAEKVGQIVASSFAAAGESLGVRCNLAGEYKVGNNWAETH